MLTRSNFLPDLVAWELDCLRKDPDYVPFPDGERDFEVFRLGQLVLTIRLQIPDREPPPRCSTAFASTTSPQTPGPDRS